MGEGCNPLAGIEVFHTGEGSAVSTPAASCNPLAGIEVFHTYGNHSRVGRLRFDGL